MHLKTLLGDWYPILKPIIETEEFKQLGKDLMKEYKKGEVFPKGPDIFRAFLLCPPDKLQVVIIGDEPYDNGVANGLAYGAKDSTIRVPKTLKRIIENLEEDLETLELDFDITLESWAKEGVLLLNQSLTVPKGVPGGHKDLWKKFTDQVIRLLFERTRNTHFVLWGEGTDRFKTNTNELLHFIYEEDEPFTKINKTLDFLEQPLIKWN